CGGRAAARARWEGGQPMLNEWLTATVYILAIAASFGAGVAFSLIKTSRDAIAFLDRIRAWGESSYRTFRSDADNDKNFVAMERNLDYRNGLIDGLNMRINEDYGYRNQGDE